MFGIRSLLMNATTLLKTCCSVVVLFWWQFRPCFCWHPLVSRCGSAVVWQPLCVISRASLHYSFNLDHVLLKTSLRSVADFHLCWHLPYILLRICCFFENTSKSDLENRVGWHLDCFRELQHETNTHFIKRFGNTYGYGLGVGDIRYAYWILVQKLWWMIPLGRPKLWWEDNIKI